MWCPNCEKETVCRVIPESGLFDKSWERMYYRDSDIHSFQRVRACNTCLQNFVTAEIYEDALRELIQEHTRLIKALKALDKIGKIVEKHIEEDRALQILIL